MPSTPHTRAALPARILLIEDDPDVRDTFADELRDAGYDVVTAEDGAVGWDVLHASASFPDAIVLDLMMPNMNGQEFRIRQLAHPATAAIPTVVFTGMPIDARVRADLGLVPVVRKPAPLVVLLAAIRAATERGLRTTVKYCECGRTYDPDQWGGLRKLGEVDNGREVGEQLELRNCASCHSTLAWEVGLHAVSVRPSDL